MRSGSDVLVGLRDASRRARWPVGLGLGVVLSMTACETTAPKKTTTAPAKEAPPPPPVTLDGTSLCRVRAEVEDARARGSIEALHSTMVNKQKAAPNDPAIVYGALLSVEDEQARWKAFKALKGPMAPLRDLGECEIYSTWKMADQAASHCEALPADLGLVDLAYAAYDRKRDDVPAALAHLDEALTKTPGCTSALIRKARLLAGQGDPAATDAAWAAALEAWPSCVSCAIARAKAAEEAQGVGAALPLWEAALKADPTNPSVLARYAGAQTGRDNARALAAYEQALDHNPESFPTLLAAARLSQSLGDTTKAVQHAEKASTVEPDTLDVWRLLADLYEARGEMTGYEKAIGEVLRLKPDDGVAHLGMARLARKDGDFVKALENYAAAIDGFEAAPAEAPTDGEPVGEPASDDPPSDDPPPKSADAAPEAAPKTQEAAQTELTALKQELLISEPGPSGDANSVVGQVQRTARQLFVEQKKKNRRLAGNVEIRVRTDKAGLVTEVEITDDTLKDARVAASLVGNLRAARFDGGAQRLRFKLEFE